MFEVEFRPRRPSGARSERFSKLLLIWFTIIAIIAVLFLFLSQVWASVITVVILISTIWFTWYYFHSAPPETEPVEVHHAVEDGLSLSDIAEIPSFLTNETTVMIWRTAMTVTEVLVACSVRFVLPRLKKGRWWDSFWCASMCFAWCVLTSGSDHTWRVQCAVPMLNPGSFHRSRLRHPCNYSSYN